MKQNSAYKIWSVFGKVHFAPKFWTPSGNLNQSFQAISKEKEFLYNIVMLII